MYNQYLTLLTLWVRIQLMTRVLDITLCNTVCQCWWFSPGTPVSSTNKTDRHDISDIFCLFIISLHKSFTLSLLRTATFPRPRHRSGSKSGIWARFVSRGEVLSSETMYINVVVIIRQSQINNTSHSAYI